MISTHSLDDEQIKQEASRQVGRPVAIQKVHISDIKALDTVFHEGKVKTVCPKDLKGDRFIGPTLFGDSYVLGRKPVYRLAFPAL